MSASNWTICPWCQQRAELAHEEAILMLNSPTGKWGEKNTISCWRIANRRRN